LLLLLDNADLILERLRDQHWALRETLQSEPALLVYGASARAIEASYKYDAAFYDFFRIDELKGLTEEELRATLIRLAEIGNTPSVTETVNTDPARIRTLHTLTGGNPRTAVLLYGVLAQGLGGNVRSDLEGLLDRVTPLYKARFEELPEQSQKLVDALALRWDPATARTLADDLGWEINPTSAQLNRLQTQGLVEKTEPYKSKRTLFQIGERFFNVWYLMRASRRVRRKLTWLVRFLRMFFSAEELREHAPANTLVKLDEWPQAEPHIRTFIEKGTDDYHETIWNDILLLFREAIATNRATDALRLLESTEAGERWRPLREALAAVVEGTPDYLRQVAPEVRSPALEIYRKLIKDLPETH